MDLIKAIQLNFVSNGNKSVLKKACASHDRRWRDGSSADTWSGVQHPGLFEQVCFILNDTFKRECGLQTPFVVVLWFFPFNWVYEKTGVVVF